MYESEWIIINFGDSQGFIFREAAIDGEVLSVKNTIQDANHRWRQIQQQRMDPSDPLENPASSLLAATIGISEV